jgi:hypothetical protein
MFPHAICVRFLVLLQKPLSLGTIHHSRRQLLANAVIAASRVGSWPCVGVLALGRGTAVAASVASAAPFPVWSPWRRRETRPSYTRGASSGTACTFTTRPTAAAIGEHVVIVLFSLAGWATGRCADQFVGARFPRLRSTNCGRSCNRAIQQSSVVGPHHEGGCAPVGTPWMWTLAFGHHENRTPRHGYKATREAAMAAFAKSWRRE